MLADAFTSIAAAFSQTFGGPYHAGAVIDRDAATYDDGGSIIAPAGATERTCLVQVDSVTEAMRAEPGYADRDVRLVLLGLAGDLTTDAKVRVTEGPSAGRYSIQSISRDPAAIGWDCRGRPS